MGSVNITHRSVGGKPQGVSTFMCTGRIKESLEKQLTLRVDIPF